MDFRCNNLTYSEYFSDFCRNQRDKFEQITQGGLNLDPINISFGSGTTPPSNNENGKKGFDFGGLLSGLTKGLGGTTFGKEVVSVKNEGQPNEVVTVTPLPSRGWIPFAIIGGVAVAGVIAYVAIKNRNK